MVDIVTSDTGFHNFRFDLTTMNSKLSQLFYNIIAPIGSATGDARKSKWKALKTFEIMCFSPSHSLVWTIHWSTRILWATVRTFRSFCAFLIKLLKNWDTVDWSDFVYAVWLLSVVVSSKGMYWRRSAACAGHQCCSMRIMYSWNRDLYYTLGRYGTGVLWRRAYYKVLCFGWVTGRGTTHNLETPVIIWIHKQRPPNYHETTLRCACSLWVLGNQVSINIVIRLLRSQWQLCFRLWQLCFRLWIGSVYFFNWFVSSLSAVTHNK